MITEETDPVTFLRLVVSGTSMLKDSIRPWTTVVFVSQLEKDVVVDVVAYP